MAKIDFKKELAQLYSASEGAVTVVDVAPLNYLMIDGSGNPNTAPEYAEAVEALYALAYSLKFALKRGASGLDYTVMPLEGLWWVDDMANFSVEHKDDWKWTMMIMQPDDLTAELFAKTVAEVKQRKKVAALHKLRLERYPEGRSVQIMHRGPYAAEEPTITKLHTFIETNGFILRGKHHEIYLSDPRKSAPEKMQTIIRQPIE